MHIRDSRACVESSLFKGTTPECVVLFLGFVLMLFVTDLDVGKNSFNIMSIRKALAFSYTQLSAFANRERIHRTEAENKSLFLFAPTALSAIFPQLQLLSKFRDIGSGSLQSND